MYVFLSLSFIPFLPIVSTGFVIILVVVIVLLIRWQVKFGRLVTNDTDYKKARQSWLISLVMLIVAVPLGFIVRPLGICPRLTLSCATKTTPAPTSASTV
ncbi:MAG TPA: hypothetical protein VJ306_23585 [Pyrinomonadaceae bacterium]|jgi:heme O synthase-like polyprenyltransferase|nr:hypothetical protein [Pyrinomonadaceae bacterium]